MNNTTNEYSKLDQPEILQAIFYPRRELKDQPPPPETLDDYITVARDVELHARFHLAGRDNPNILFFHGNGEIVADYNDLGPLYISNGLNFMPVDYRGYGRSTGRPTVAAMMMDCHAIFEFTKRWLRDNGYTGRFIVMGRSLGSAPALELASHYVEQIDGLIVESGFAYTGPLLALLGINTSTMDFREEKGFLNLEKIQVWEKPTLVIHAEFDHIIPFSDGQALYDACPAPDKTILKIPGANHNDIFMRGLDAYMRAVRSVSGK